MASSGENTTISLNAKSILEKTFVPHGNGYDPEEVDDFLDQIIRDYMAFESYYRESREYTINLENALRQERDKIKSLEVAKASYEAKFRGVKDSDNVSSENIQLISRIRKLENALYRQGIDPNSIK
ncbi:MAG: DivIVA domain-containing protein [Bacilli bacterium]|nr:DivIVA domain-containing protein [Bacilli bacterium]